MSRRRRKYAGIMEFYTSGGQNEIHHPYVTHTILINGLNKFVIGATIDLLFFQELF